MRLRLRDDVKERLGRQDWEDKIEKTRLRRQD